MPGGDAWGRGPRQAPVPPRAARIGAGVGFAVLLAMAYLFQPLWPTSLMLSGRPIAAGVVVLVTLPIVALMAALAFATDATQRLLARFTAIDLRDGGHVAAAVLMALTLFFALGLSTVQGIAVVEDQLGPLPDAEPPPTAGAEGAPSAPNLTANVTSGRIALDWTFDDGTNASNLSFRVYRGLAPDALTFLVRVENATNHTDATAFPGSAYHYAVSALNAAGEGPASNVTSVLLPVPSDLIFSAIFENLIIFVLPVIFYVSFVHGVGPRGAFNKLGFHAEGAGRAILVGVVAVVVFEILFAAALTAVSQYQEVDENERAQAIGLGVGLGGALLIAVGSSLSEEVLFRGFLQPRIGMLGQAAVFAIAHLSYVNVVEIVVTFGLALLFGFLYKRTGSLWAPIAGHFAFNLLNLVFIVCSNDPTQCGLPA